mgnify:FL=1
MCAALLVFLIVRTAFAGLSGEPFPEYSGREGERLRVTGIVSAPYEPADGSMEGASFYLSQIEGFSEKSQKIICYPEKNIKTMPRAGSRVQVEGKAKPFRKASNPGEFDAAAYYGRKGILFSLQDTEILRESSSYSRAGELLARLRHWADACFLRVLGKKDGATASAMVLGVKRQMDEEVKALYAGAGISHLLSISGLHLSLIGMGLFGLLHRLFRRLPRRILRGHAIALWTASGASALVLYAYAQMTGMSVSTSRALAMFVLLLGARLAGRTTDLATSLTVAAALILAQNPQNIYDAGFQLSFSAVAGIAAAVPVMQEGWESRRLGRAQDFSGRLRSFGAGLWKNALASFGITLVMLPFLLAHYYAWSPWSAAANLAVIPLMGILLPCLFGILLAGGIGELAAALGTGVISELVLGLSNAAAAGTVLFAKGILGCYEAICRILLKLPFSVVHTGAPKAAALIVFFAGLALLLWKGKEQKPVWRLLCAAGLTCVFLIRFPEGLRITMLDVGQGACVCVETPSREVYLLDAGSTSKNDTGNGQIVPYLKYRGVKALDGIFVSHWDADHINGIEAVLDWSTLENVSVKRLLLPDTGLKDEALAELLALAGKHGVPVEYVSAGSVTKSGKVRLFCFHPPAGKTEEDRNAVSMVLRLEYGGFSALFTGDLEEEGEEWMVQRYGSALESTVLDAGHHGSGNATKDGFLDAVKPKAVLISCGKDNSYGHPAKEMIARVEKRRIPWYVTARDGALTIKVNRNGERFFIVPFTERRQGKEP